VAHELRPEPQEVLAQARVCLQPICQPVEPSARLAQDGAGHVHGRRGDRVVVRRPDRVVARADSARMRVPLEAFRLEHDAPPGKSKGELLPTEIFWAG